MIILKPGLNSPTFTLREKFNFFNPSCSIYTYYILKLTNQLTHSDLLVIPTLISTGVRYDQFNLTISTASNADVFTGNVSFIGINDDNGSQWVYEMWICDGIVPTGGTLSIPSGSTSSFEPRMLESGKMIYKY